MIEIISIRDLIPTEPYDFRIDCVSPVGNPYNHRIRYIEYFQSRMEVCMKHRLLNPEEYIAKGDEFKPYEGKWKLVSSNAIDKKAKTYSSFVRRLINPPNAKYRFLGIDEIILVSDEGKSAGGLFIPVHSNCIGAKVSKELGPVRRLIKPPTRPELVANLPEGTECVGLVVFKEKLILATTSGVYFLNDKESFESIKYLEE